MKDLYRFVKEAKTIGIKEIIVFFSTGKDSIATLDLCCSFIPKVVALYLYTVKGISFREKCLNWYAKKYGCEIQQLPFPDLANKINQNINIKETKKKMNLSKVQAYARSKFNIDWVSYGFKYNDSLHRRGFLKFYGEVDTDHKKFYPIAEWSNKDVLGYCKRKKLPLPVEYYHGFNDITEFTGPALIWLANNYPADFEKVKKVFPMAEGELIKAYDLIGG